VLLRLAYLAVMNTFAVLRLLPANDRDKDVEVLALRHRIAVLGRQLGGKGSVRPGGPGHAGAVARLRLETLRRMRLLVRPDTVLRWHRDQHGGPPQDDWIRLCPQVEFSRAIRTISAFIDGLLPGRPGRRRSV
jgi:hypothetical protein